MRSFITSRGGRSRWDSDVLVVSISTVRVANEASSISNRSETTSFLLPEHVFTFGIAAGQCVRSLLLAWASQPTDRHTEMRFKH